MSYQSLYRKYRPARFDQVVGQGAIVNALTNAIRMDRISHAYLLTGPRGTGKTTVAKLYAAAINCENKEAIFCGECENCKATLDGGHPDIIEIDAASNNGVDEIRSLIEKVKYMPLIGKYKVYIIDEVHMLSQGAFNALLKTLEEPPEHIVFILATTEAHKVLPTIISRCQRYDFRHISTQDIEKQLEVVLSSEHRDAEPGVTQLIASLSGGGMRNALTILEQAFILNEDKIELSSLYDNYGLILPEEKINLFETMRTGQTSETMHVLTDAMNKTVDLSRLLMDIITSLKDSLVYHYTKRDAFININDKEFIVYLDNAFTVGNRNKMLEILLDRFDKLRYSTNQETHFELAILALLDIFDVQEMQEEPSVVSSSMTQVEAVKIVETRLVEMPILDATPRNDVQQAQEDVIKAENTSSVEYEPDTLHFTDAHEEIQESQDLVMSSESAEKVAEPVLQQPIPELDLGSMEIVQFMVSADKESRMQDEAVFQTMSRHASDLKWARVARLLMNSQLVLSGESFVVVAVQRQAQSREIMESRNLYELIDFMEHLLGKRKQVFATTTSDFQHAVEEFKILSKQNTLPDPLSKDDFLSYEESEDAPSAADDTETLFLDLFGDQGIVK